MERYCVAQRSPHTTWEEVPFLEALNQPWFVVPDIRMLSQLRWDQEKLYVHQIAYEKNIRATHTEHLSPVCEDSCMEFFIAPKPNDARYFNFELNPNGALMLGFGRGRADRIRLLPKNPASYFAIKTKTDTSKWEVFYEIPLAFFDIFFPGIRFEKGLALSANFYKCGDKTLQPHYLTWNPVTSPNPDYHRPSDFGQIILN